MHLQHQIVNIQGDLEEDRIINIGEQRLPLNLGTCTIPLKNRRKNEIRQVFKNE